MSRFCILGTAPSFRDAPFDDPEVLIASLNDAYLCKGGLPRVDEWYDPHPLDHFFFQPPKNAQGQQPMVYAHDIPFGHYIRPAGHLDWLATQPFPVWLHPDHATQVPASADWPSARAFPKAEIEAHFGRYFGSTPAWMLAHAILRGFTEIDVYGIHLSTEQEYLDQRPNFEYLLGCLLGSGKRTITVTEKTRIYESPNGRLTLPVASPVLDANFQYAFEPSPRRKADPLHWQMHKATVKRDRRVRALVDRTVGLPWVRFTEPNKDGQEITRTVLASTLQSEIKYFDALLADYRDQIAQVTAC